MCFSIIGRKDAQREILRATAVFEDDARCIAWVIRVPCMSQLCCFKDHLVGLKGLQYIPKVMFVGVT